MARIAPLTSKHFVMFPIGWILKEGLGVLDGGGAEVMGGRVVLGIAEKMVVVPFVGTIVGKTEVFVGAIVEKTVVPFVGAIVEKIVVPFDGAIVEKIVVPFAVAIVEKTVVTLDGLADTIAEDEGKIVEKMVVTFDGLADTIAEDEGKIVAV